MPVNLKPTSVIIADLGLDPTGPVQKWFTQTCAIHMDKYVPYREGILSQYRIEGNNIIYGDNGSIYYAAVQYYGMRRDGTHKINEDNRDRSKHPLATSYWDKKMWTAEGPDIVKEVQAYFNRGGK